MEWVFENGSYFLDRAGVRYGLTYERVAIFFGQWLVTVDGSPITTVFGKDLPHAQRFVERCLDASSKMTKEEAGLLNHMVAIVRGP